MTSWHTLDYKIIELFPKDHAFHSQNHVYLTWRPHRESFDLYETTILRSYDSFSPVNPTVSALRKG